MFSATNSSMSSGAQSLPVGGTSPNDDGEEDEAQILNGNGSTSSSPSTMTTATTSVSTPGASLSSAHNNSHAIRQEIFRFENVHPAIYAVYDLLDLIGGLDGQLIAQRIRDYVVSIEDSFVNSQEWTLSRDVSELRLGVLGTMNSGKSALVHRYLTGSYLEDESPEGGRFKKEVVLDGQSHLLLIRDEGESPHIQFSCWVDAVVFVFSVVDESSFNAVHSYHSTMFHLRSSSHEPKLPIILVGALDGISESRPRVIDERRARRLAADMRQATYFETCATYGQNVEKVFNEACRRILDTRNAENIGAAALRSHSSTPTTSIGFYRQITSSTSSVTPLGNITNNNSETPTSSQKPYSSHLRNTKKVSPLIESNQTPVKPTIPAKPKLVASVSSNPAHGNQTTAGVTPPGPTTSNAVARLSLLTPKRSESVKTSAEVASNNRKFLSSKPKATTSDNPSSKETKKEETSTSPAFASPMTPVTIRKNRRKSNLFTPLSSKSKNEDKYKNGEVGSGRTIPIKQGYLYKKSIKTLNKEWKKKYVTLTTDGCLTYHRTLHDYMGDVHGKNIELKHTTVKVPGQKPRCGARPTAELSEENRKPVVATNPKYDSSSSHKKRSRKLKSMSSGSKSGEKDGAGGGADDSDGNEFVIVSLDNKQWHFNAYTNDDREEWITAIEAQILSSLQALQSDKRLANGETARAEEQSSQIGSIRTVPGNGHCADCGRKQPDWASLNLGTVICIECSGLHRKLGTHLSKVRSLALDVWPPSHVAVMLGLGNTAVNRIWEAELAAQGGTKPSQSSSYEEKEAFVRAKYVEKAFLAKLDHTLGSIETQLVDAVLKMDIKHTAFLLAYAAKEISFNFSFTVNNRDRKTLLHLAASRGCLEITQLLLWYNVNDKAVDGEGKTAHFYARIGGHKEVEELLLTQSHSSSTPTTPTTTSSTPPPLTSPIQLRHINPTTDSSRQFEHKSVNKRRETMPINFKTSVDMFDKLPSSII